MIKELVKEYDDLNLIESQKKQLFFFLQDNTKLCTQNFMQELPMIKLGRFQYLY